MNKEIKNSMYVTIVEPLTDIDKIVMQVIINDFKIFKMYREITKILDIDIQFKMLTIDGCTIEIFNNNERHMFSIKVKRDNKYISMNQISNIKLQK